jgi:hypothetical protein
MLLPTLRHLADSDAPGSYANKLRARRFRKFESLVSQLPKPLRSIDIGGTNSFWENRGWADRSDIQITTVNIVSEPQRYDNIKPLSANAADLRFLSDLSFDVAFSNSVIEHLFNLDDQRRMATEIQRVASAFWVQTPNYWFPMEPHFHVPGWQWMPRSARVSLIRRRRCGWRGPCRDLVQAQRLVDEVRLLTKSELRSLFPNAVLIPERFLGAVKSWIVVGGFRNTAPLGPRTGLAATVQ